MIGDPPTPDGTLGLDPNFDPQTEMLKQVADPIARASLKEHFETTSKYLLRMVTQIMGLHIVGPEAREFQGYINDFWAMAEVCTHLEQQGTELTPENLIRETEELARAREGRPIVEAEAEVAKLLGQPTDYAHYEFRL
jgi:hypothetical protein